MFLSRRINQSIFSTKNSMQIKIRTIVHINFQEQKQTMNTWRNLSRGGLVTVSWAARDRHKVAGLNSGRLRFLAWQLTGSNAAAALHSTVQTRLATSTTPTKLYFITSDYTNKDMKKSSTTKEQKKRDLFVNQVRKREFYPRHFHL